MSDTHGLLSTGELVERAQRGDGIALEALFARHVPGLRAWARGRLPRGARDLLETDDLVQETLVRTFGRIRDFEARGPGAFGAYLRRAVLNRVRDEARRVGRRPRRTEFATDPVVEDPSPSPLELAVGREALDAYESAFAQLSPADQAALHYRLELGFPYGQLAIELDKPSPDAARMAVNRALCRLAELMKNAAV